jgi:hypothetical protein
MRCRRIGWIAVNMKNNQKRSPIDMGNSYRMQRVMGDPQY